MDYSNVQSFEDYNSMIFMVFYLDDVKAIVFDMPSLFRLDSHFHPRSKLCNNRPFNNIYLPLLK